MLEIPFASLFGVSFKINKHISVTCNIFNMVLLLENVFWYSIFSHCANKDNVLYCTICKTCLYSDSKTKFLFSKIFSIIPVNERACTYKRLGINKYDLTKSRVAHVFNVTQYQLSELALTSPCRLSNLQIYVISAHGNPSSVGSNLRKPLLQV